MLVYCVAIWSTFPPIYGHLVYFVAIWKIWQPWSAFWLKFVAELPKTIEKDAVWLQKHKFGSVIEP
jgi:hypothetical protein